jgi:hypothetical protein
VIWEIGRHFLSLRQWIDCNGSETLCISADIVGYADFHSGPPSRPQIFDDIESADLDDTARANIYGQNVVRFLGRRPRGAPPS